jgi:hypothetical protein
LEIAEVGGQIAEVKDKISPDRRLDPWREIYTTEVVDAQMENVRVSPLQSAL